MPLKDLLVSEKDVNEELVERILRGFVQLSQETQRAMLTPMGMRQPARIRILLVMAAQHAWRFIDSGAERSVAVTGKSLERDTGISPNTLRPTLAKLAEERAIESEKRGVYQLPARSLLFVEQEIGKVRTKPVR